MPRILDSINEPQDLKRLDLSQLKELAAEIRSEIVSTVKANGGHLASNLGVVELTIALHRVFHSPRDKILWDVGHQSYVHKLLTGRRERFSTLRQMGGLSGFAERSESPHDPFGTGHGSTSISAALGMAIARDLSREDYSVVAVIGDGALGGGMAFEALNQAGHLGKRLIVVLNDNAMSISPNVGALSRYLDRVRFDPRYHRAKEEAEHFITRLPFGIALWKLATRFKNSLKGLLMPTMIWEELGFTYMGPFDGHDVARLEAAFALAKDSPRKPTFIHVVTTKGKGYAPAEEDPVSFHSVAPKDRKSTVPSYSEVFKRTILRLFEENPRVVAITASMPEGTGLKMVAKEYPERVFDVGFAEEHAVTFAAGLATQGYIPIVAIYSTFLQRAFDQVLHDVCLQNLPVVFALDRGGIVGDDGKTHQGTFDLSYLGCMPNMVIAAPSDENELQHLLYTAVKANRPMAIRYPRGPALGIPPNPELRELPMGKGRMVYSGNGIPEVAIIAIGYTVAPSLEAAQLLAEGGIQCAVVDARYAKPLDSSLILDLASRAKRVITVEENTLAGGFGSAVLSLLQEKFKEGVKVERIGIPDDFVEHGPQSTLRAKYDLDGQGIMRQVLNSFPELARIFRVMAGTKEAHG